MPALLGIVLGLRLLLIPFYRVDSDEPQHLHVAWGWSQGLVQYRDVFDNHVPLFHLLMAPIVKWIGPRPDIIIVMRLMTLPTFLITLWAFHRLARRLSCPRRGRWAVAILSAIPTFFLCSMEFRADDLWMMFWQLSLLALLGGEWHWRRGLAAGLLLGATLASSLKTIIMLGALMFAGLLLLCVVPEARRAADPRRHGPALLAVLVGLCVVPGLLIALLRHLHALHAFFYCTVTHNILPGEAFSAWQLKRLPHLLILIPSIACARRLGSGPSFKPAAVPRAYLLLLSSSSYLALAFYPLVQTQTLLPFIPLFVWSVVEVAARPRLLIPSLDLARVPMRKQILTGVIWLVLVGFASIFIVAAPWKNNAREQEMLLSQVLRLTNPSDKILDAKGETVFRQRSYYYVLEHFTKGRLKEHLLPDQIVSRTLATHTRVVISQRSSFPEVAQLFLTANFLPVGQLSVAGKMLPSSSDLASGRPFDIFVPARYSLVGPAGVISGRIDGVPVERSVYLATGRHEFIPDGSVGPVALVWTQAVDRGFTPFIDGGNGYN